MSQDPARGDAMPADGVIVVGYDGSPESRLALAVAVDRARDDATVVPVHVMEPTPSWLGAPYYGRAVQRSHAAGARVLSEVAELGDDATLQPELIEGDPAEALIRVADARGAREIVVGSRRVGRMRALFGSVSRRVRRRSRVPVVVVSRSGIESQD